MKKLLIIISFAFIGILYPISEAKAQDPITLIIKEGIKKVIVAVDLKIQRLQTKTIWLQNAQKLIENEMTKYQLNDISGWVQKQKELYQDYFDELWKVKTALSYYHRIREVMDEQVAIVKAYKRAYTLFKSDKHFTLDEITYMGQVYTGILEGSAKNLDELLMVVNSFSTQLSDAKRLEIINSAADAMQQNYNDLKAFNKENILISLERAKEAKEIAVLKALYGL